LVVIDETYLKNPGEPLVNKTAQGLFSSFF
jgi:hypothetical protein